MLAETSVKEYSKNETLISSFLFIFGIGVDIVGCYFLIGYECPSYQAGHRAQKRLRETPCTDINGDDYSSHCSGSYNDVHYINADPDSYSQQCIDDTKTACTYNGCGGTAFIMALMMLLGTIIAYASGSVLYTKFNTLFSHSNYEKLLNKDNDDPENGKNAYEKNKLACVKT